MLLTEESARADNDPKKGLIPLVVSLKSVSLRLLRDCPEWVTGIRKSKSKVAKTKPITISSDSDSNGEKAVISHSDGDDNSDDNNEDNPDHSEDSSAEHSEHSQKKRLKLRENDPRPVTSNEIVNSKASKTLRKVGPPQSDRKKSKSRKLSPISRQTKHKLSDTEPPRKSKKAVIVVPKRM
jgi:hypothetical protein